MSGRHDQASRVTFQDWLLDHDAVYEENHRALVAERGSYATAWARGFARTNRADEFERIGRWQYRSSIARCKRAGLLDANGRPALNSVGQRMAA